MHVNKLNCFAAQFEHSAFCSCAGEGPYVPFDKDILISFFEILTRFYPLYIRIRLMLNACTSLTKSPSRSKDCVKEYRNLEKVPAQLTTHDLIKVKRVRIRCAHVRTRICTSEHGSLNLEL